MIREIVVPIKETCLLHIPEKYIDRRIEILILPFDRHEDDIGKSRNQSRKKLLKKTAGLLRAKKIDPMAWQDQIRQEWDR